MAGRDLSRVRDREALRAAANAEPYWQRLRPGCFVGYAPSAKGGDGTWFARAYDPDTSRYQKKRLGAFPGVPGNAKFAAAKQEAERFAELTEAGGHTEEKIETVGDACRAYATTRPEAAARFRRYVYDDPIAKRRLDKLRRKDLEEWRKRLAGQPSLVSRSKEGEQRTRDRALSTINRDMAVVRAALNSVLRPGIPGSAGAWQEALKAHSNADGRRTLYLDRTQRRRLLDHLDAEAMPFVKALCLLPMRPGAMATLDAGAFDKRTSELTIGKDKAGKARRIKVPREAATLLASQIDGKLPSAPLFTRANGSRWNKDNWKQPIAKAVEAAALPSEATAYTLRHSTITDLVAAGLPLLTIAQISGTSAEMIERHYGHLVSDAALKALRGLSL
ncbi:tyrosine-type recombinase/integrase [Sphingomonas fuzhouensis]|uniref:tyrosine-type recombinase/integrase n=1 Tax=Sphingomonas fuzhouensis TaxID=3106033 RepID=UPI002AFF48DB|nr:tyrosine-type recombinase/integrase [Sphingomonas sp. SGZ-02]